MAYYHIDTNQRYLQSLGFTTIQSSAPIEVDAHGDPPPEWGWSDHNAWYDAGNNIISFGTGYTDAAEDAGIIWHEYGHAIQIDQIGWDDNPEYSAIKEGFADYWSISAGQARSNYRPAFLGKWFFGVKADGTSAFPGFTPRNQDNTQTYTDYDSEASKYKNCLIWGGSLWELRGDLGRTITDRLVIQSHYYMTTSSTMPSAAKNILDADRALYSGSHNTTISSVFHSRGMTIPFSPTWNAPTKLDYFEERNVTVTPYGGIGTYSYQWYEKPRLADSWESVGSNSNTYRLRMDDEGGLWVKCVITSGSQQATLTRFILCELCDGGFLKKKIADLDGTIPLIYALNANYPNPFNPVTRISYDLPETSRIRLVVFDIMGKEVRSWTATESGGFKNIDWNGTNNAGQSVSGGVYIYRLIATSVETGESFTASNKMVFLK